MAKLSTDQLAGDLKKGLAAIYLISGDEPLLVQECGDAIRQAAVAAGHDERELYHADHSFDWNQLHLAGQSLSLFSSKKIIELRLSGKLHDAGRKALVEYAAAPPADIVLLVVMPKLERSTQSAKWFKTLETASRFIQVWPVDAQRLPQWIMQRAGGLGLQLDKDAVDILASRVEGNLLAAVQELEKLRLLSDSQGRVDAELMAQAVANSARYDMYSLVDRALRGDAAGAARMLHGLQAEGTEVLRILWPLGNEVRKLLQISEAMEAGKPFNAAAREAGVWDKRQSLVQAALKRLNKQRLFVLLRKAAQADKAAKGMAANTDPWAICLDLILNLAGFSALNKRTESLALRH